MKDDPSFADLSLPCFGLVRDGRPAPLAPRPDDDGSPPLALFTAADSAQAFVDTTGAGGPVLVERLATREAVRVYLIDTHGPGAGVVIDPPAGGERPATVNAESFLVPR